MLDRLGRLVTRFRWSVIAAALVVGVLAIGWGTSVFGSLADGGFGDPDSESARARDQIEQQLDRDDINVIAVYSSDDRTVDDAAFSRQVQTVLEKVRTGDAAPEVAAAYSYYDDPANAGRASPFVSEDRHATYVAIRLDGSTDADRADAYTELKSDLIASDLTTRIGGSTAVFDDINSRIKADIARAEMIALPIVFLLSLIIFGGLVAALMPLVVGAMAVLGAFLILRTLTVVTDVSVFALNIVIMLGLGLAIDYSLFIISRFREELAGGHSPRRAAIRAVATAGRTVVISGLTVIFSMAGLLVFPQLFLRSMGLGGMAAVGVAVLASVTVLPAILALLGHRINAGRIRLPFRRKGKPAGDGAWTRIARVVMRRPVVVTVGALALLLVLAAPVAGVTFGGVDARMLPAGTDSREVVEQLRDDFNRPPTEIDVLVSSVDQPAAATFAQRVNSLDNVHRAEVTQYADDNRAAVVTVSYMGEATNGEAREIVTDIRALQPPAGSEVLVGGDSAELVDLLQSLRNRLPWMVALIAGVTAVALAVAFGSLILPLKAIVMNVLSLAASFGVVVYIFGDGHFADLLGFTPTGFIEATQPILMIAILFGLSMDYELFLLSRIREEWDTTRDNTLAVQRGLQRTGGIITAAALLLVVVVAGFAMGGITLIKMVGVGMIVAIILDATVIRALLVPAVMRLLGKWNWWLPAPLARLDARRRQRRQVADSAAEADQQVVDLIPPPITFTSSRK